jgi:predicted  nucleic acid-binding Zn-ribbon protein
MERVQAELEQLLKRQDRAQKIRQLEAELRSVPLERRSLEQQGAAATAKLEGLKERLRQTEVEKKTLELDVGTRNESIARLRTQQYETRKNDEFAAMGREIERFEKEISDLEDRELELMERTDQLKDEIAREEKELNLVKQGIAKQLADLDSKQSALSQRVEGLRIERGELAGTVDEDLLDRFNRLFASKGDAAVVALEHDVCAGCHMKVTTATAARVRADKEIVSCEQCGRILFLGD